MTKKHFIALAAALRQVKPDRDHIATVQWERTVMAIVAVLEKENGQFDRRRFLAACGASEMA